MNRRVSFFIPVRFKSKQPQVFLQLRSHTDDFLPGYYGLFGGHVEEGETFEEGLKREVKEELNYETVSFSLLDTQVGKFDGVFYDKKVYWELVQDNFEEVVIIGEGDGGVWVTEDELEKVDKIFPADLLNLQKLFDQLKQNE